MGVAPTLASTGHMQNRDRRLLMAARVLLKSSPRIQGPFLLTQLWINPRRKRRRKKSLPFTPQWTNLRNGRRRGMIRIFMTALKNQKRYAFWYSFNSDIAQLGKSLFTFFFFFASSAQSYRFLISQPRIKF